MKRLAVRVTPRSAQERLRWDGQVLHVWVSPAAVDGAANQAMLRAVARWLHVPPSALQLVSGATSRTKLVEIPDTAVVPEADGLETGRN